MDATTTLMELLQGVDDPRAAKGKRHPLHALLALSIVAMLAGQGVPNFSGGEILDLAR